MAEAIVNSNLARTWQAFSTGIKPTGIVHPLAMSVLKEIGINHHGVSENVSEFQNQDFDLIVTVCDDAAENCPVWLRTGKQVHMPFPDPVKATGDNKYILSVFRQVRDDINLKIPQLLNKF